MRIVAVLLVCSAVAGHSAFAQAALPAAAPQIAAATAPLPAEFRESATVLGYRAGSSALAELRRGEGPFICLADNPADTRFHVACYHRSLDAFMARGRELRAAGRTGEQADSVRTAEIGAGRLRMPEQPAALYSLTGDPSAVNPGTGEVSGARPLFVVYIPFATAASTGLPATPARNAPWIMNPGTAKAHIMFVPDMN